MVKRLWSLLDMFKRFETRHVLAAMTYIGQTERKLRTAVHDMTIAGAQSRYEIGKTSEAQRLHKHCSNLRLAATEYELLGLNSALDSLEYFFNECGHLAQLDLTQTSHLHTELVCLHATLKNALADSTIYFLTRGSSEYITGERVSFGDEVDAAFPSSTYDIQEASKCRGLERWTACVMHCCRALEPALKALEDAIPVEISKEQWGDRINQVEAAIRKMNKATHSKEQVQWFSDAATQFHFMKAAWRNYAQHLKHTYDEERAVTIYDAVRTFMRHLAKGGLRESESQTTAQ